MAGDLYRQLGDVARSPAVRAKLAERADRIAGRARSIAASDKADDAEDIRIGREDGIRPKGRPYARVTAPLDQEFGTSRVARRRILGRAAGGS